MQEDGKVVDGSLLGDANGVEPGTGRQKESGKWQRPRFTRKALMRCCLVKWIIASTGPKEQDQCYFLFIALIPKQSGYVQIYTANSVRILRTSLAVWFGLLSTSGLGGVMLSR
ncbi:calsenilin-like [Sinocyclocheilus grahami]|uniref:calsenilin-like n=1 Tax=Sinocyclocheilus grahami TaxID=75366 RepID=UPI0007AD345D|nr:PREDICTED: calsenilin-like [Sinocyclocheilus grahami]